MLNRETVCILPVYHPARAYTPAHNTDIRQTLKENGHKVDIPDIIKQRVEEANKEPTIQKWRSIAVWVEDMADKADPHNKDLASALNKLASIAYDHVIELSGVNNEQ
jgi:hypothetical protein